MKLIIDIPEDELTDEEIQDAVECAEDNFSGIVKLSGNFTNGDVIKAMFPDNVFAEDKWRDENGVTWHTDIISDNGMTFTDFWWNAPYQKGGK